MKRRQFLTTASTTVAVASMSGCLGNVLGGGKEIFKNVATEGTSLVVTFSEETDIRSVDLITSGGQQFNSASLSSGEYKAAIGLLSVTSIGVQYSYTPGTYTLVAVDGEGNEYNREVTLQPNTSVTDISFLHEEWGGTYNGPRRHTAPVITIDNSSDDSSDILTGPDVIVGSGVVGPTVPQPAPVGPRNKSEGNTGLIPLGKGLSDDFAEIGAHTTQRALTSYLPFVFSSIDRYNSKAAVRRQWADKTIDATLILVNLTQLSTYFTVEYGGNVRKSGSDFYITNSKVASKTTGATTSR